MGPPISSQIVESIEDWFRCHDDGQFSANTKRVRSTRIGNCELAATIIYTTKHLYLSRVKGIESLPQPIATIGRYGLPINDDLWFVRGSTKLSTRIFIGDADPPDILVFAWLREHFPIEWHGVNDEFLKHHGNRDRDSITIRMSQNELASIPNLKRLCPDFRDLLGEYGSSLVDGGFKIELEGAIFDYDLKANS